MVLLNLVEQRQQFAVLIFVTVFRCIFWLVLVKGTATKTP